MTAAYDVPADHPVNSVKKLLEGLEIPAAEPVILRQVRHMDNRRGSTVILDSSGIYLLAARPVLELLTDRRLDF
jgi:hypothetical protein